MIEELDTQAGADDLHGDPAREPLALDDVREGDGGVVGDGRVEEDEGGERGLQDGGAAEADEGAEVGGEGVGHAVAGAEACGGGSVSSGDCLS